LTKIACTIRRREGFLKKEGEGISFPKAIPARHALVREAGGGKIYWAGEEVKKTHRERLSVNSMNHDETQINKGELESGDGWSWGLTRN